MPGAFTKEPAGEQQVSLKSGQAPYDMLLRLPLLPSGPDGVHQNRHCIGPGQLTETTYPGHAAILKIRKSPKSYLPS